MEMLDWMQKEILESELISEADKESRMSRWGHGIGVTPDGAPRPLWATLKPDFNQGFRHWSELLRLSEIDERCIQDLQYLVKGGQLGWAEGCRILAHFWKDGEDEFVNPSRWLQKCIRESQEARQNHEEWDFNGNAEPPGSGRPAGASRDPWREYDRWVEIYRQREQEILKGKGKGKGKGIGKGIGKDDTGKAKGRGALYRW